MPATVSAFEFHFFGTRGRLFWSLSPLLGVLVLLLVAGPSDAAPISAANADMDRVCTVSLAGTTDRSTAANNAVVSDVTVGNDALNAGSSVVYFGMNEVWKTLVVNVGTAGTTGTVTWTYWNGAWAALAVTDGTNHFKTSGTNTVTFTSPADWAETEIDGATCTGARYFIRASTSTSYTTLPLATQISSIEYNLKVKVQDELGNTHTGLASSAFIVADGTVKTVFASRDLGAGVYELALDMGGTDHDFNVRVDKDGYARAATIATGSLTTTMTDKSGTPFSLSFALKVVPDDERTGRTSISGATVTAGDSYGVTCTEGSGGNAGNYYCAVPIAHTSTSVKIEKDGYVTKTLASAWTDRRSHSDAQAYAPSRAVGISGAMPDGRHSAASVWTGTDVYLFGGCAGGSSGCPTSQILRYHPATNTWQTMSATLPSAREGASAVWTGTYAYVFGGQKTGEVATNEILRYDPIADTITVISTTLPGNRFYMAAAWTGDYAFLLGGQGGGVGTNAILKFDPDDESLTTMTATLPSARWRGNAVWDGSNYIYYFGGMSTSLHLDDIIRYAPGNDTRWELGTNLPTTLARMGAVWSSGSAYLIGGFDGTLSSSGIVKFDPAAGITTMGAWLPTARHSPQVVWDGSKAVAIGGFDTTYVNQVVTYDPSATHAITTMSTTLPAAGSSKNSFSTGTYTYILAGGSTAIYRYDNSGNTITTLTETLPQARSGTSLAWDGSTYAYIFAGNSGGQKSDIYWYKPSTGTLGTVSGASFSTARDNTVACWANGKAYIFGGYDLTPINTIHEFTPTGDGTSGTLTTKTATLPTGRTNAGIASDGSKCYLFGGWTGVQTNQILEYNPSTDTLTTKSATLPSVREKTSAVWAGAVALVFGGWDGGARTDQILQYDPIADSIVTLEEKLPSARDGITSITDGSRFFMFGGNTGSNTNQIVRFDLLQTARTIAGTLPSARSQAAVGWDGSANAYIFGGKLTDATRTDEILRYTPSTNTIRTMKAKLPSVRSGASVVWDSRDLPSSGCDDGCFYIFGGISVVQSSDILRYNPKTDAITTMSTTFAAGVEGTSAVFDGTYAYIFGGNTATGRLNTIIRYDPSANTKSTMTGVLPTARNHTAAAWDGTYAYIFGGYDGAYLNQIVRYHPATDTVATMGATLPSARNLASAVWDGTNAYVFGGKISSSSTTQLVRYTPSTDTAADLSTEYPGDAFASARNGVGAIWDGSNAYAFGGHTGSAYLQDVVKFTPTANLDLPFAFKVTGITSEISSVLSTVTVTTGDGSAISCSESIGAWYCAVPLAHTGLTVRAAKDGYVTTEAASFASDRTANTDAQRTVAVTGVNFALKVTSVANELSSALSTVTVTAGNSFGTSCTESGSAWYCAVPLADTATDVKAAKDGYVTKTATSAFTDRTAATDAQKTATVTGVAYAYKVTSVAEELGNSLTTVTIRAGNSQGTSCTESGGAWYCAVPLADTILTIEAAKDGYVTHTGSSFGSDRTAATDAQVMGTVTGVKFAYKVTAVNTEISTSVTSVTVNAGNSQGIACTESGGAWYCAVPLAHTTLTIQAAKDGYVTDTGSSFASDRTAATDAQVMGTVASMDFAFKVTGITTEASASITSATVATGDSFGVSCTESSGAWYCAVPLAQTGIAVRATKDGYITNQGTSFASDRTLASDAQRTVAASGVLYTVKLTAATETDLSGVTWEKKVGAGSYNSVTPTATSSNVAYFAQTTGEADVIFRAGKYSVTSESGAAFTASAASQTARTLNLVAALTGLSSSAANSAVSTQTTYTFGFTLVHAWPADGRVNVTFPAGFALGSPAATLTGADGSLTASVSGQTVSLTRSGATLTSASTAITLALTQITNPAATGSTGTFTINVYNAAWVVLDTGAAPAETITGALASLTTTPANYSVGATTTWTFGFTTASAWPANGKVTIAFPATFTFGSPAATLTGATGTATVSVSSSTVTVTRANDGAQTAASTAVTVALTDITNPPSEGSSGTFTIIIKTSTDGELDTGTAPAVTLTANPLSVRSLTSSSHAAGSWSTSRTVTVTWLAPTDPSVVGYSWGWDADPDNVVESSALTATLSSATDGTHTFKIKAKSGGGTWGPVLSYANMGVDATAPTAPSIGSSHAASTCTANAAVSFSWSASDAASGLHATQPYGYSYDGASATRGTTTSSSYSSVADGSHTMTVTAYDKAGNAASTTYTVKVDTTAPTLTLTAPAYSNGATLNLTFASTDACSTVASVTLEQRVAAGTWQALSASGSSGTVVFTPSSDGSYEFRGRATDNIGNAGTLPAAAQATTVVDRVAPGAAMGVSATPQAAGSVRITWNAATDDRSGVNGYYVYRVDATGKETLATSSVVSATEFVDAGQSDGLQLRYAVRAVDRATNLGPSAQSGLVVVDGRGPVEAPRGLTADGLQGGLVKLESLRLRWEAVADASEYAVYVSDEATFPLDADHRLGTIASTSVEVLGAQEGPHYYAVVARDAAGNEGPSATLSLIYDAVPPQAAASAPSESGPAVSVSWSASDPGTGVARIEIWALEASASPEMIYVSDKTSGAVTFYGVEARTYHFFAVGQDKAGHKAERSLTADGADATTKIVSSVVVASPQAVAQVAAAGGDPSKPFYAEDADRDGFPETFVDPSNRVQAMRVMPQAAGHLWVLGEASAGDASNPLAVWDPSTGRVENVALTLPVLEPTIVHVEGGRLEIKVTVENKQGWIYIPVEDAAPGRDIEGVWRSDGVAIPEGQYWRVPGHIVVMDDPVTVYRIVYSPQAASPVWLVFVGALVVALGAAVAWLEWPSVARLVARPPKRTRLGWVLRFCAACEEPLGRRERILRMLHTCRLTTRLRAQRLQWSRVTLSKKILLARVRRTAQRLSDRIAPRRAEPPKIQRKP